MVFFDYAKKFIVVEKLYKLREYVFVLIHIFYFEIVGERIILLFLYDKTEMENVPAVFIEQILQTMLTNTAGADLQRPVRL